jgi:LmbE family N-acetylglucosaminyl deacetylase
VNVLVIAPHPDDEAIGCGGTICLHTDRGDRVVTVFLTSGELALQHLAREGAWRVREGEARNAARVLGTAPPIFLRGEDWFLGDQIEVAATGLRTVLAQEQPEIIYLTHVLEWHPDHKAAGAVVQAALQHGGKVTAALRTYEVWTPLPVFDHVEDISTVLERKLDAVRCYGSQLGQFKYDRAVEGLNRYRGALAGRCDWAEVFGSLGDGPVDCEVLP